MCWQQDKLAFITDICNCLYIFFFFFCVDRYGTKQPEGTYALPTCCAWMLIWPSDHLLVSCAVTEEVHRSGNLPQRYRRSLEFRIFLTFFRLSCLFALSQLCKAPTFPWMCGFPSNVKMRSPLYAAQMYIRLYHCECENVFTVFQI